MKNGKYAQKPNLKCAHPQCSNILGLKQSRTATYCSRSCASRNRIAWNKGLHDKNTKYAYKKCKKDLCERCGFIPEDSCQLDVDHKDGNHDNNSEDNLQTLCANCHRLKTKQNKETANRKKQ